MFDHKVSSQSRPESLTFRGPSTTTTVQSLNGGNTAAAGTKDIDNVKARDAPACTQRRVSMTLLPPLFQATTGGSRLAPPGR